MKFNVPVLTYTEEMQVSFAKTECSLAHGLRCWVRL